MSTAVNGNVKFGTGLEDTGAKAKMEDSFSERTESESKNKNPVNAIRVSQCQRVDELTLPVFTLCLLSLLAF